jgi:hypothetical protein
MSTFMLYKPEISPSHPNQSKTVSPVVCTHTHAHTYTDTYTDIGT